VSDQESQEQWHEKWWAPMAWHQDRGQCSSSVYCNPACDLLPPKRWGPVDLDERIKQNTQFRSRQRDEVIRRWRVEHPHLAHRPISATHMDEICRAAERLRDRLEDARTGDRF